MKERVIIFDFDGVIADSLDEVWKFYRDNAVNYGLPKPRKITDFTSLYDGNFFKSLFRLGISPFALRKLSRDLIGVVGEKYKKIRIFPGMKGVLQRLSKTSRIVIISSNYNGPIGLFLDRHKIKIDKVIGADKEKSKVVKIERIKKEFPKSEIFYVGDTMGDVIEGRKAGVKTVGVTWGYHSKSKIIQSKPGFVVEKPGDLLQILESR